MFTYGREGLGFRVRPGAPPQRGCAEGPGAAEKDASKVKEASQGVSGVRVEGLGLRVWGLGFRV